MTSAHLQQLASRLDGQGFEAGIIGSALLVISPARESRGGSRLIDLLKALPRPDEHGRMWYEGEARRVEIITCKPRETDGGRPWFFDRQGEPIDEASHVIDAAVRVGGRLAVVRVAQ